jgi:hypothetical protein
MHDGDGGVMETLQRVVAPVLKRQNIEHSAHTRRSTIQ